MNMNVSSKTYNQAKTSSEYLNDCQLKGLAHGLKELWGDFTMEHPRLS